VVVVAPTEALVGRGANEGTYIVSEPFPVVDVFKDNGVKIGGIEKAYYTPVAVVVIVDISSTACASSLLNHREIVDSFLVEQFCYNKKKRVSKYVKKI
jgi:hypothetical protein